MELFAKKIEKQLASYQQELIETHYREVDNMYRQIRGWRHDYRNHIQTMKAYAAAGDWDAIQNYLDLLDTDLQTVDTVIKTGNPMTDAILNSKISLAKAKGLVGRGDKKLCPGEADGACRHRCQRNDPGPAPQGTQQGNEVHLTVDFAFVHVYLPSNQSEIANKWRETTIKL